MKIHEVEQGSEAWLRLRSGIPTASEFHNLVTPTWKIREGEGIATYLAKKLAEKWRGTPLPGWGGGPMEQGSIRESEAIPYFEIRTGRKIRRVGFITTDDGKAGCSPDGLFKNGDGIEVKCPEPHTQVRYLLDGVVPDQYQAQVQGSLFVTGAAAWTFLSYCPSFPPLIVEAKPIPKAFTAIEEALKRFCDQLEDGFQELKHLYGGTPPCDDIESLGF